MIIISHQGFSQCGL